MQVNQMMPISLAVLKGVTAAEQPADQVSAVGQTSLNTPNMEVVAQTFAKLEQTLLQWFFTQRPELGNALAQLLSLQEQLISIGGTANPSTNATNTSTANPSTSNLNSTNANTTNPSTTNPSTNILSNSVNLDEKLVKILDMMKMLLISPGKQPAEKSDVIRQSPQTLLALIGELKEIQKEQPPALQTKIDNIAAKLTTLVKQMISISNICDDVPAVQQQTPGGNLGGGHTSPSATDNIAAKNENVGANTTMTDNAACTRSVKIQDLPVTTQAGQPANDDESAAYLEVLVTKNNNKSSANITRPQLEQISELAGFVPEDEVNTGLTVVSRQNTPESNTANSINKAVETQQKLLEILRQFSDVINKHEPSGKLREILRDLTACAKALQINPETEWESLLRYPIIYKQTLNKALKLLQELINTKNSDNHSLHGNIVGLLSEISANLHVQNSINQLRQENPANQTMYFQIPLQVGNEIKNGEMLVVHQREQRGNKWEIVNSWYRFYLETQYLGPVQINLHAANKKLNIQFLLTDKEQAELFNRHKLNLNQVLTHYGYEVVDITCSAGEVCPLFLLGSDSANHRCVDIMI